MRPRKIDALQYKRAELFFIRQMAARVTMIPVPPYLDNLCQQFDVPPFDRFAMLRNGSDAGIATFSKYRLGSELQNAFTIAPAARCLVQHQSGPAE
ncbi:hypothetical protein [Bradyrhizobium sp.]|uniref:hypothetical protein n=1 Tax=Bradyrhizobium sp. TaxID=376 RepID=UPI003C741D92